MTKNKIKFRVGSNNINKIYILIPKNLTIHKDRSNKKNKKQGHLISRRRIFLSRLI